MSESAVAARVKTNGFGAASPFDLAAIGFARREADVDGNVEPAKVFLRSGQRLNRLAALGADDLAGTFGLEGFEVVRALALLELGRRASLAGKGPITSITGPADVAELLDWLKTEKREHLVAVLLDAKNNVLRVSSIHIGTLTESPVGPREIFREAIREGASSLIIAHNHPSGDPTPSPEDLQVTARLVEIGLLLDIPLLDHVVIGDRRWVSLEEAGAM